MKTARKLLCLALVLVMALGVVPFASAKNAADYTDIASVTDPGALEALYVMSHIGVTEGYPEGHFGPSTTFTRAEASTIIARILLGDKAATLPKSGTIFTDVPADFWASGYISFCTARGIVAGYGDGTFGPQDTLTSAAFVTMLLRALGIGDANSYKGESWYMDAYADAIKEDSEIFTLDVDFLADATREQVVIYAFNAIQVFTGDPVEKYQIIATTASIDPALAALISEGKYYDTTTEARAAANAVGGLFNVTYTLDPISVRETGSLAESVFGLSLDPLPDDLGRPDTWAWFQGTYPVPLYVVTGAGPIATYDANFTAADLYKVTGKGPSGDFAISGQLNSGGIATTTSLNSNRVKATPGTHSANAADLGFGVRTEIYKTGRDKYEAVVIKPSFGRLTITAVPGNATVGARDRYTIGAITADDNYIVYTSHVDAAFEFDSVEITGEVKSGDMVLYYRGTNMLYIEAVDTITGVLSGISSYNVFTIDGKTHNLAKAYDTLATNNKGTPGKDAQGFYVDSFGNILGSSKPADTLPKVALLVNVYSEDHLVGTAIQTKYMAMLVNLSGTVEFVETVNDDSLKGTIVAWTFEEGKYIFEPSAAPVVADAAVNGIIRNAAVLGNTSTVTLANNATKFVVVQYTDRGATSPAPRYVPNGQVVMYTGISNVPGWPSLTPGGTIAVSYPAPGAATANAIADIVYINQATISVAGVNNYAFYGGSFSQTSATEYTVDLIIDGVTVPTYALYTIFGKLVAGTLYKNLVINEYGAEVGTTVESPAVDTGGILNYNNGALMLDADYVGAVEADTPVYTFRFGAVSTKTAAEIIRDDLGDSVTGAELHIDATEDAGGIIGNTVIHAIYIIF